MLLSKNKKILIYILLFSIILIFQISSIAFAENVSFMDETLEYDQMYSSDVDGNGYVELTFYMQEDELILSIWDTDEDGLADHWFAYEEDDVLITTGLDTNEDGQANEYFAIDLEGKATPIGSKATFSLILIASIIGVILILLIVLKLLTKKTKVATVSIFLVMLLVSSTLSNSFADLVIDDDCSINEDIFDQTWIIYSDVDFRVESATRNLEGKEVQSISDSIRSHYSALLITEFELAFEKEKREQLKNIKSLLVRNIKNNLLKSFMRLTYVTCDTIYNAYGSKGSISTILDRSTAGAQIITSAIKLHKSLSLPSKTEQKTKSIYDRVEGITNSTLLESIDSALDPKKIGTNLVTDLMKETFDIVKTEDNWDNANLSEADFKILKTEYTRNRELDVAIQESDLITQSMLIPQRDFHEDAIESLKEQYIVAMALEKARVKDMLINSCKSNNAKIPSDDEDSDSQPQGEDTTSTLPQSGIPTADQLTGDYTISSDVIIFSDNQSQTASGISTGSIEHVGNNDLLFTDFTEETDLIIKYKSTTGYFETVNTVEGVTYTIKGNAIIQDSKIIIYLNIDGYHEGGSFQFDSEATKIDKNIVITTFPKMEHLIGLYQMTSNITITQNEKVSNEVLTMEVIISIVNDQLVFMDTASEYTHMMVFYNELTGILNYYFSDYNMTLNITGKAIYENGNILITIVSDQIEEDYHYNGRFSLSKLD